MGETKSEFVARLDAFIAAPKAIVGFDVPEWMPNDREPLRHGRPALMASFNLEVGDENTGGTVQITSWTRNPPTFKVNLQFSSSLLARLEFGESEPHQNPLPWTAERPAYINSSHCHLWADNRKFAAPNIHWPLQVAILLPVNLQHFETAFRWFCGQHNIVQPGTMFDLPDGLRLL